MGHQAHVHGVGVMERFRKLYGAGPLHLVGMVVSLTVAWYAAAKLVPRQPWNVTKWFVGSAVIHDVVLLPFYAGVDWMLRMASARAPGPVPWINHARVPAFFSGLLLLVYFPLIGRKSTFYERATTFHMGLYFGRWMVFTVVVFALSAGIYGARVLRANH
jgi:hypothetical protein